MTTIINRILAYIPNILVALLILGLGAFLGTLLSGVVRPSHRGGHGQWVNFVSRLRWVPRDKQVSFIYRDSLWTVPAD